MNPTSYLWILKFGLIAAIVGASVGYGYKVCQDRMQPVINGLNAQLLAIDLKAQSDEVKYKENLDAIEKKSKRDRAAVDAYYRGLLSKASDNPSPGQAPESTERVGTAPGQSALTGCDIDIERRCVEDALRVRDTAEFFKVNNFPVE